MDLRGLCRDPSHLLPGVNEPFHRLMGPTEGNGETSGESGRELSAPSDATLLGRVAAGDREAFAALYERYRRRVFTYFVRMVADAGTAEELTDDVLLEVWRGAKSYRSRSSPSTWIFGIAHHKALNEFRKKREAPMEADEVARRLERGPSQDEEVGKGDLARIIKRLLPTLSPEHREVLELTYYQGLSVQEVADVVGCPVNTVKTRMFYARQRLKALLLAAGVAGEAG